MTVTVSAPAVTVSAPGKLILMGEHAVVYGRPALVAAIDLRMRVRFSPLPDSAPSASPLPLLPDPAPTAPPPSPPSPPPPLPAEPAVEIELPGLGHRTATTWREILAYARAARDGWTAYAERPDLAAFLSLRGTDPAHVVKVALGEVAAALGEDEGGAPSLHLRLDSELPIGAGCGSSAAAVVAIVAGYAVWRERDLDAATISRLALEAERRQHGLPSGVDTATSFLGGVLWARRLPPSAGGGLACERLAGDPTAGPLLGRLRVVHTGTPAETTGAVVAAVRTRRDRDPAACERLFDRMEAATRGLLAELGGAAGQPEPAEPPQGQPARVVALIREHEDCLEALGVVPAPVRALVRRIEAAGGAAKVSGAGSLAGPGAGSLLVYHPDPAAAAAWELPPPHGPLPVHLGAAGFRRETS